MCLIPFFINGWRKKCLEEQVERNRLASQLQLTSKPNLLFMLFTFSSSSLYKILETHQPNRSSSPLRFSSLLIFNILSIFLFYFTPISLSLSLLPLYFSHSYFLRSTFLLPLFLCLPLSFSIIFHLFLFSCLIISLSSLKFSLSYS